MLHLFVLFERKNRLEFFFCHRFWTNFLSIFSFLQFCDWQSANLFNCLTDLVSWGTLCMICWILGLYCRVLLDNLLWHVLSMTWLHIQRLYWRKTLLCLMIRLAQRVHQILDLAQISRLILKLNRVQFLLRILHGVTIVDKLAETTSRHHQTFSVLNLLITSRFIPAYYRSGLVLRVRSQGSYVCCSTLSFQSRAVQNNAGIHIFERFSLKMSWWQADSLLELRRLRKLTIWGTLSTVISTAGLILRSLIWWLYRGFGQLNQLFCLFPIIFSVIHICRMLVDGWSKNISLGCQYFDIFW